MTTIARIASNLKKCRMKRNMGMHELSRQSHVSCCLISLLESGKRGNVTIDTLERLAKPLNMKMMDFFAGKEDGQG